jgi:hypothetical protein
MPDPRPIVRRLLSFLLIAEGVTTLFWLVQLLSSLMWRDRASIAIVLARGVVGAMQLTSGWWLAMQRLAAPALARVSLLLSAGLITLEIGARLSPSDLDPTFRWPLVGAYWVYALVAAWWLRSRADAKRDLPDDLA